MASENTDSPEKTPLDSQQGMTVAVLLSGRGSNLEAILAAQKFYGYFVQSVISDKKDALGLVVAEKYGVPEIRHFDRQDYPNKQEQREALYGYLLGATDIDLVCLAGFMQIVPEHVTQKLTGKLINIHPSLLPKYPGLDTHQQVLDAKEIVHGASVHCVDAGIDTGKLIAQVSVAVSNDDTEAVLAARVLKEEHRLYPWVAAKILNQQIKLAGSRIEYTEEARDEAARLSFSLIDT